MGAETSVVTLTNSYPTDAVFSPDGSGVYVTNGGGIDVFASSTGALLDHIGIGTKLGAVDVSSDGHYLAAAELDPSGSGAALVYYVDLTTGSVTRYSTMLADDGAFADVTFSSDGELIVSGARHLFSLETATSSFTELSTEYNFTPTLVHAESADRILIDPFAVGDVPLLLYSSAKAIFAERHDYYDPYAGASVDIHDKSVSAISADGSMVFDGYQLAIYNGRLHQEVRIGSAFSYLEGGIAGAVFAPDDSELYLFDAWTGNMIVVATATGNVIGSYALGVRFVGPNDQFNRQYHNQYGNTFQITPDGHVLKILGPDGVSLIDMTHLVSTGSTSGNDHLSLTDYGVVYGFDGDDVIVAPAGALFGGNGNDTYKLTGFGANAFEDKGQGTDHVISSVDYELRDNIENLTLVGLDAYFAGGNGLANIIVGNAVANELYGYDGADAISGGRGSDILAGGRGSDVLTGGGGSDIFYFEGRGGSDIVTDFLVGRDKLQINVSRVDDFGDLTVMDDGNGGTYISWKGGRADLEHVAPGSFGSGDVQFGFVSSATPEHQIADAGSIAIEHDFSTHGLLMIGHCAIV